MRRTNFKVQKGHMESINKFHQRSSLRERERIIMYGNYPGQCKKISNDQELIQSDPTSYPQNQKGNN